jgi:preprotein translocase subunit SecG
MLSIVANIFYVLIAIAMTVLILLQRGAGANAGSGFGGGASATVFGARGSANFLSRSTAVLAGLFFLLSLGMGIYLGRDSGKTQTASDLGVMAGVATPAKPEPATAPATSGDAAPAPTVSTPAAAPAAPAADMPAPAAVAADKPAAKADKPAETPAPKQKGKDGK